MDIDSSFIATVQISIDVTEDSKLATLRDKILEVSDRFQSFSSELFSLIEEFGRPMQVMSLAYPKKRILKLETVRVDEDEDI